MHVYRFVVQDHTITIITDPNAVIKFNTVGLQQDDKLPYTRAVNEVMYFCRFLFLLLITEEPFLTS